MKQLRRKRYGTKLSVESLFKLISKSHKVLDPFPTPPISGFAYTVFIEHSLRREIVANRPGKILWVKLVHPATGKRNLLVRFRLLNNITERKKFPQFLFSYQLHWIIKIDERNNRHQKSFFPPSLCTLILGRYTKHCKNSDSFNSAQRNNISSLIISPGLCLAWNFVFILQFPCFLHFHQERETEEEDVRWLSVICLKMKMNWN